MSKKAILYDIIETFFFVLTHFMLIFISFLSLVSIITAIISLNGRNWYFFMIMLDYFTMQVLSTKKIAFNWSQFGCPYPLNFLLNFITNNSLLIDRNTNTSKVIWEFSYLQSWGKKQFLLNEVICMNRPLFFWLIFYSKFPNRFWNTASFASFFKAVCQKN